MFQLTLQLYSAGQWLDAMTLAFPEPEKGLNGPCHDDQRLQEWGLK